MKSKDRVILEVFCVKYSSNLIGRKNFETRLNNETVKLLEITDSICCFHGWKPIRKKLALYMPPVFCGYLESKAYLK